MQPYIKIDIKYSNNLPSPCRMAGIPSAGSAASATR